MSSEPLPPAAEQVRLDQEDDAIRYGILLDAIQAEKDAEDAVKRLRMELTNAQAKLRSAKRRLADLVFVERARRQKRSRRASG